MELRVEGLRKRYPTFELSVPYLDIPRGQCVGLVGNNGAGKTTLLRCLLDLTEPDAGEVRIGPYRVGRDDGWKPDTGAFLDSRFLFDFLRPYEYFRYVGSLYGRSADEVDALIGFYAGLLGPEVTGRRAPLIRDLSTGNARKVGLVGALLPAPRLIVLDEPFATLDPRAQMRLRDALRLQTRDLGTTLILSSHNLQHVSEICDRVVVIDGGRIARDFRPDAASLRELETFFSDEGEAA
jgi:ABC-2 type transport system ATP-binding protein